MATLAQIANKIRDLAVAKGTSPITANILAGGGGGAGGPITVGQNGLNGIVIITYPAIN